MNTGFQSSVIILSCRLRSVRSGPGGRHNYRNVINNRIIDMVGCLELNVEIN